MTLALLVYLDVAHREHVAEVLNASTRQERDGVESEFGVRYSELLRLPYYLPIQFVVVDPMHNLFLGTAKTFLKNIWLEDERPLLSKSDMITVQERIDSIRVPSSIGRIPSKIASNFVSLTADQWRSWTTIFSPVALRDLLPKDHLQCWLKYVDACRLLCRRAITATDLQQADDLIHSFLEDVRVLYARHATPNMHLLMHLSDSIRNFGPAPAFWLFGFENLNGILGAYKTNRENVEIQIMRKVLLDLGFDETIQPKELKDIFGPMFERVRGEKRVMGGVASSVIDVDESLLSAVHDLSASTEIDGQKLFSTVGLYTKHGPFNHSAFDMSDVQHLTTMYQAVLGESLAGLVVPQMHTVFQSIEIGGQIIGSRNGCRESLSYIFAKWTGQVGKIMMDGEERPGQIQYFVHHRICWGGSWHDSLLAAVLWNYSHDMKNKFDGVTLWCADHYQNEGPSFYMPVQRIVSLFCPAYDIVDESRVMFPCPLSL